MATNYLGQGGASQGASSQNGNINTQTFGASNSNSTSTQTGTGNTNQTASNTYSPAQQALQGQAATAAGNFLQTGNLPGTFGTPSVVTQAYMQNFNQNVAPELAAQDGAGSPAIGSQLATGLLNLEAQTYQNQSNDFSSALNSASNIGFTATGNTAQSAQNQNATSASNTTGMNWQDENQQVNMANAASNLNASMPQP